MHSNTFHYGLERCWSISYSTNDLNNNKIAIGYDDGTIMIKLGTEKTCCIYG